MFHRRNQQHDEKVEEWYYHLMHDPEYFERWRYTDTINNYKSIIEEFQKLNRQKLTDRSMRVRIQSGLKQAKQELAKTQTEYKIFKKYKKKTGIDK